jgi:EAL domain-containing protein (putative c-di-GMP-specific phosphodiesterase class I)
LTVEIRTIPEFSFAYQPIVDIEARTVFAYEALVRGPANEPAGAIFGALDPRDLHRFDLAARLRAIELAASLGLATSLSLNLMPQALDSTPDAISSTIEAALRAGIPTNDIIIEVTEGEMIQDMTGFAGRMNTYRAQGVRFAIDDFGAGFSGLNLLAEFQPDEVKLDMHLVRDIESKGPRQAIVRAVIQACDDLGIDVIAEGLEKEAEYRWFKRAGVRLFQGYWFCRPGFETLAIPVFPA